MIDSVLLRVCSAKRPPGRALSKFLRRGDRRVYRDELSRYSPTLSCFRAPDGKYYLTAQASLPKLVYGNNVRMLSEACLDNALALLGDFASQHLAMNFDVSAAAVGRVDYCRNFFVGEEFVCRYLEAAARAEPPRLKRHIFGKIETVEFANASRKIYCYDKRREAQRQFEKNKISSAAVNAARGILRLEARYNTTAAAVRLSRQLGVSGTRVPALLNFDVAERVLMSAVEALGLDQPVIAHDGRLDKLRAFCGGGGGSRFQRLAGFLYLCDAYGYDKLIELGIMKRSAYYKQRRELIDAGALVFSDFHEPLPALRVM